MVTNPLKKKGPRHPQGRTMTAWVEMKTTANRSKEQRSAWKLVQYWPMWESKGHCPSALITGIEPCP